MHLPFPLLADCKTTTCENHLEYSVISQIPPGILVILLFSTIETRIFSELNSAYHFHNNVPQKKTPTPPALFSRNAATMVQTYTCLRTHKNYTEVLQIRSIFEQGPLKKGADYTLLSKHLSNHIVNRCNGLPS